MTDREWLWTTAKPREIPTHKRPGNDPEEDRDEQDELEEGAENADEG